MVSGSDLDLIENISAGGGKVESALRKLSHSPNIVADSTVLVVHKGEASDLDTQGLAAEVAKDGAGGRRKSISRPRASASTPSSPPAPRKLFSCLKCDAFRIAQMREVRSALLRPIYK